MKLLRRFWAALCFYLISPFVGRVTKKIIYDDLRAYCEYRETKPNKYRFIQYFSEIPEFRSIVYYRLKNRFRFLPKLFLRPQTCCFINSSEISGGLILIHGFSTIINAKNIGRRVTIFQQVTVGCSQGYSPVIGDDCVICCGAKVIGNVHVGNNVTIGAGAIVVKDVPNNAIVAGNPAKIIGYNIDCKAFPSLMN